jgi:hypothetical protein
MRRDLSAGAPWRRANSEEPHSGQNYDEASDREPKRA